MPDLAWMGGNICACLCYSGKSRYKTGAQLRKFVLR